MNGGRSYGDDADKDEPMSIETLAKVLEELGGRASITLEEGAFHTRVIDDMAGQLDGVAEDIEETAFDVEMEIVSGHDPRSTLFIIRAACTDFDTTFQLCAGELDQQEVRTALKELVALKRKVEVQCDKPKESAPKVIIRKRSDNSYDLHAAAQKLNVGSEWLKKAVPCSGYRCTEGDAGKKVLELRYHREMIERLCQVRDGSVDAADIEYVAHSCCEGDTEWAHDIIAALKSKVNCGAS